MEEDCGSTSESEIDIDDGVVESYRCLLCSYETTDVSSFFAHLKAAHQWDLYSVRKLFADQYVWITFANWTRKNKPSQLEDFFNLSEEDRLSYLQPVLQDDAVLTIDVEALLDCSENAADEESQNFEKLQLCNEELRFQLSKCKQLLGELIDQPHLEYSRPVSAPSCTHSNFGLNTALVDSPLVPTRFLIDKMVLNSFGTLIKHSHNDRFAGNAVLNLFDDAGMLSMFAADAGAKLILIPASTPADVVNALCKSNNCKINLEVIRSLDSLPVDRVGVLLWDWLGAFLLNVDQSKIFSLIRTQIDHIYPRVAYLKIVGVNVKQEIVKSFIPSCKFADLNTVALADVAYKNVYLHNWTANHLSEVTDVQVVATLDIQKMADFSFEESEFSLHFTSTAKMNGLLMYLCCAIDGEHLAFSTMNSSLYGKWLIFLKRPIDGLSNQTVSGALARRVSEALLIRLEDSNSSKLSAEYILPHTHNRNL